MIPVPVEVEKNTKSVVVVFNRCEFVNFLYASLTAILSALSFNFPFLSFFIWFSFVPFLFLLENLKGKSLFFYSFFVGSLFSLSTLFWIGYVTKLGLISLSFYLSFWWILFAFTAKYFISKCGEIYSIAFLWIIFEFLRENIGWGFGWLNLGYSQYLNTLIIQPADLVGTKFISWLIILCNLIIKKILREKRLIKEIFVFLGIIVFCLIYSNWRINTLTSQEKIKITLIQPNILQEEKWNPEKREFILKKLKELTKKAPSDSLVIYPEASFPFVLEKTNFDKFKKFLKEIRRDTLWGVIEKEEGKFFNEAMLLDKEANLIEKYKKIKLVPFGEYVPLRNLFSFIPVINTIGDFSPGKKEVIFKYKDKRFSVLICFEDIFPFYVAQVSKKVDFLVNITNDAWFKGNPEAHQHLSILTLRSIENRISSVRCANTGISAMITPTGKIFTLKKANREVFVEGIKTFFLPLRKKRSFYNKYPDIFVLLGVIFNFFVLVKGGERCS